MIHCKTKEEKFAVTLYDSVASLPKEWNDPLPQDHFLQTAQLTVTEQSNFPDVSFQYAFISLKGKPFAIAYFQVLHVKPYHVETAKLTPLQGSAWQVFSKLYHPKLLVAGHLFRHDVASFFYPEDAEPFEVYQCYDAAIRAALKKSGADAILVKDMPQSLITYFQHYAPQYLLLRNDITMEMAINSEWENFKDYEKSLKHKYAQRLRKVRQQWDKLEVTELTAPETEKNQEIIFNLYKQVTNKQQVRFGYLSADYISTLKKNYPDDFHVWMAYEQGVPVAFFSAWSKGEAFDMFYIGFDYSRNEALQLYFNILFFSVEQAIRLRKEKLVLGRTALEAKARVGCKPVYLSTFLYIKNSLVRSAMLRMQQNVADNEGEWENRHPFK